MQRECVGLRNRTRRRWWSELEPLALADLDGSAIGNEVYGPTFCFPASSYFNHISPRRQGHTEVSIHARACPTRYQVDTRRVIHPDAFRRGRIGRWIAP